MGATPAGGGTVQPVKAPPTMKAHVNTLQKPLETIVSSFIHDSIADDVLCIGAGRVK
jgi:hypothetical protein